MSLTTSATSQKEKKINNKEKEIKKKKKNAQVSNHNTTSMYISYPNVKTLTSKQPKSNLQVKNENKPSVSQSVCCYYNTVKFIFNVVLYLIFRLNFISVKLILCLFFVSLL